MEYVCQTEVEAHFAFVKQIWGWVTCTCNCCCLFVTLIHPLLLCYCYMVEWFWWE